MSDDDWFIKAIASLLLGLTLIMMFKKEANLPNITQTVIVGDNNNKQVPLLSRIADSIDETKIQGIVEPLVYNITTTKRTIRAIKPWFSVTIVNDGPNAVNILTNSTLNELPHIIRNGETYRIEAGRGVINNLQAWCDTGTALTRITGLR